MVRSYLSEAVFYEANSVVLFVGQRSEGDPGFAEFMELERLISSCNSVPDSIAILQSMLTAGNEDPELMVRIGALMVIQGSDPADALKYVEQAVSLDSGDPNLRYSLGTIYWLASRIPEACGEWRRVIEMSGVVDSNARVRMSMRLATKMINMTNTITELLPNTVTEGAGLEHNTSMLAGSENGFVSLLSDKLDEDALCQELRYAIDESPNNSWMRCEFGKFLFAVGRLEEARLEWRTAISVAQLPRDQHIANVARQLLRKLNTEYEDRADRTTID